MLRAGFLSCGEQGSRPAAQSSQGGLSCCEHGPWSLWPQELWRTGLTAPRHMGSSWTKNQTCVPYIGRRILNRWATREVPASNILNRNVCKAFRAGRCPWLGFRKAESRHRGLTHSPLRAPKGPQQVCQALHQALGGQGALAMSCSLASRVVLVVRNLPANAGDIRDVGLIPGSGRSPGGGQGNPLQYSCPENPMERRAWGASSKGHTELDTTEAA